MMHFLFLFIIGSATLLHECCGFSTSRSCCATSNINLNALYHLPLTSSSSVRSTVSSRLQSTPDKQSEIAALEERLKELKEEESTTAEIEPDDEDDEDAQLLEGSDEDSIMFSEKWKEAKDGYITKQEENNMGAIAKVGLAIGGLVLLGLFSQIPVGEESLQRYQDIKGNPSRIDLGDLNPDQ